ncbi:hypothetical protein JHS3_17130 [Jeongeupia sp. HS-3]|uniref:hypothetical protein n=1 Tax=Jeongeupia sp. HS-3 TaxID=1009682 RepID=UPI0018A6049E|nr:hypothetical protein [Jeongeupia sp. HS-3]BCL75977.1 hypothetical protein JHS3_17130 [Jeongeupia sp. HS-3]
MQLNAAPTDFAIASQLAEQHLKRFRRDSDPCDLGQADAVIARWLNKNDPPATALLLRASILQVQGKYAEARQSCGAMLLQNASLDSAGQGDARALGYRAA